MVTDMTTQQHIGTLAIVETQPVTTNPAAVYLASLQPSGRRTMAGALRGVAQMLGYDLESMPWQELEYQHVQALRAKLSETKAPGTTNKVLAAVRGVMRSAWRMGKIDAEHYQRVADVKGVTGSRLPAGRAASPGELQALMRVCGDDLSPAGARDSAIIALGYGGGLRRAELASLDLEDVTDDGDLVVIRVIGKRNKERLCYLDNGAALAVQDWIKVRGDDDGPLFWSGRRGGRVTRGQRMTPQAIRDVIDRRAKQAGIEHLTPHDLRRSFVSDLLDSGVDISTVAGMAGHAQVETTRRYDRRGEVAKQRAARSLHVPYVRRGVSLA